MTRTPDHPNEPDDRLEDVLQQARSQGLLPAGVATMPLAEFLHLSGVIAVPAGPSGLGALQFVRAVRAAQDTGEALHVLNVRPPGAPDEVMIYAKGDHAASLRALASSLGEGRNLN